MVANAHCFPVFLEWRHHWPNLAGCSHCMRDIQSFAMKPRLLLLDESVNGLDFQSTEYLYQQILMNCIFNEKLTNRREVS